jgi:hypothetical protein
MALGTGVTRLVVLLSLVGVSLASGPPAANALDFRTDRDRDSFAELSDLCPGTYSIQVDSDADEIGDQCDPTPSEFPETYLVLFFRDQYGDAQMRPACYHYVFTHDSSGGSPFVSEGDYCSSPFASAYAFGVDAANAFHARFTLTERSDDCSAPPIGTEAVLDATAGGVFSTTWRFRCRDVDNDRLTVGSEERWFTSDADPDSDNDGATDGAEVHRLFTRPTDHDSDNGGQLDGAEARMGNDPLDATDDGIDATALAKRYAPQIVFHPNEQNWPLSAETFVRRSPLRFAQDLACGDGIVAPSSWVVASRLGGRQAAHYRFPFVDVAGCEPRLAWTSEAFTRPRDDSQDRNGLATDEGYFLDLPTGLRDGKASASGDASTYAGAPIYFRVNASHRWIRYLIMYGWGEAPGGSSDDLCCHEGDWEGFTIRFNENWQPMTVFLTQGQAGMRVSWKDLTQLGETHPVVYSSKDAHASYPAKGSWSVAGASDEDLTGNGRRWSTWLAPTKRIGVYRQGWWGFGGAWGGLQDISPAWESVGEHFVGPIGPSPYLGGNPWQCSPQCYPEGYTVWPPA